jgi:hypothetical protein
MWETVPENEHESCIFECFARDGGEGLQFRENDIFS